MHFKSKPEVIVAPNPSAMTLDGTRTFIVGHERLAIIDPGPRSEAHLNAVADHVGDGVVVCVLVTHNHPDHAEGAAVMADRFRSEWRQQLRDGDRIETDAGPLLAMSTPGHTPDHFSFIWDDIAFCGDLMMGGLDTALVAPPEGNLRDYLDSLRRLRDLNLRKLYPAHGPEFDEPKAAVDRYMRHRADRLQQVEAAMKSGTQDIFESVYGSDVHPKLRPYAEAALQAYIDYLHEES